MWRWEKNDVKSKSEEYTDDWMLAVDLQSESLQHPGWIFKLSSVSADQCRMRKFKQNSIVEFMFSKSVVFKKSIFFVSKQCDLPVSIAKAEGTIYTN